MTSDGTREPEPPLRRPRPKAGSEAKPLQTELPLFRISEIVVASSGVLISTDLIEECCERGIRLSFLTPGGRPYAMLTLPMLTATVLTRREQLAAYGDRRGAEVARAVVRGKLTNQADLLKCFGKYLKEANPAAYQEIEKAVGGLERLRREAGRVEGERVDDIRGTLMGIEGASGRLYWDGVKAILGERVAFETREHRGATNLVNSALNLGERAYRPWKWWPHTDGPGVVADAPAQGLDPVGSHEFPR